MRKLTSVTENYLINKNMIPTKDELNPKPKKGFWQIVKRVVLFVLPMVIKNQKGIKGTKNENVVDTAAEIIKEL